MENEDNPLLEFTADIVAAHVSNNSVALADLPQLIMNVHGALQGLGSVDAPPAARAEPKVSIRASVKPDHIVCLEDGKRMTMLKRHLRSEHGMTPDQYREKWGLNRDYPMAAPNYAEKRRALAKSFGLGSKKHNGNKPR